MYLTARPNKSGARFEASYNPTIASLYKDKAVLAAVPFFGSLYETFVNAVPRPRRRPGSKYNQVSSEFWDSTARCLVGTE